MSALDWLRAKTRQQRPPATGGPVAPGTGPVLEVGTGCTFPAARLAAPGSGLPAGARIEITMRRPDIETTAAEMAAALRRPRPAPNGANCGCVPRYSRCYCPDNNARNGAS